MFTLHAVLTALYPDAAIPDDDGSDRNVRMQCPRCNAKGKTGSVNYGKGKFGVYRCFNSACGLQGNPVELIKTEKQVTTGEAYDWAHANASKFSKSVDMPERGLWYKGHAYRFPGFPACPECGEHASPWHSCAP